MSAPWLTARTDGTPSAFAGALRRVDDPSAPATPFRSIDPIAAPSNDAAARELAALRGSIDQARARAEAEGRDAGKAEIARTCELLAQAAEGLIAERSALLRADAATLVDLALEVAGALVGRALAADRDALEALVGRALAAADAPSAIVRVHPEDLSRVAAMVPTGVKLDPDPALARGEVRVETERAVVDGSAAARLAALREPLIAALEEP